MFLPSLPTHCASQWDEAQPSDLHSKMLLNDLEGCMKRFLKTQSRKDNGSVVGRANSHRLKELCWKPPFLRRLKHSPVLAYELIFNKISLSELLGGPPQSSSP
ncbi:hypothetical protein BV898_12359 [Hypsibius exemplaris]|uniref:Uncharacterized protein n=1 Tax=Hypsibius exemplaris TaxID=2072580 RepID=A0A1W0WE06_HYPEX|nr:hypothetical protein BV898_12359 [Hypsibius exemplaris]